MNKYDIIAKVKTMRNCKPIMSFVKFLIDQVHASEYSAQHPDSYGKMQQNRLKDNMN